MKKLVALSAVVVLCLLQAGMLRAQVIAKLPEKTSGSKPDEYPEKALDRALLKTFPPAVVVKVYELTREVSLSNKQQLVIARRFAYQDSLTAAWLLEGKPVAATDSLVRSSRQFLFRVLDRGQMLTYQRGKDNEFASIAADGEFQYIRETYNPDVSYYPAVQNMLNIKYGFLYQQYQLFNGNRDHALKAIANTSRVNDLYNLFPLLYTTRFANEFLDRIRTIRSIQDSTAQAIRNSFYSRIANDKMSNWNQAIEEATMRYLPDTALFSHLHRMQFEKQAAALSKLEGDDLIYMHRVSRDAYDSLYPLLRKKNYVRTVLEYTYSRYQPVFCDSLQRKVTRYYDSAIEATLLRDGSLQPVTQFAIALKYKDKLQLSQETIGTILQDAMYLEAQRDSILQKDPFAAIDFDPYQAKQLSALLTDDQYDIVLTCKNRAHSMAAAQADWEEMEQRGLTGGFFKDQTIDEIFRYNLRKDNAWNRLAADRVQQWATSRIIGDTKPAALKILDPIRWNGITEKTTNNLKLKW